MSDYKELVNSDYIMQLLPKGGWIPNQSPTEIKGESLKNLTGQILDKNSIVFRYLIIQTSCTYPGYQFIIGNGQINTTAEKNFLENQLPFRKDDMGQCNGFFKNVLTGAIIQCNCNMKFTNAGQVKCLMK
jgi:hypothetical protein